MKKKPISEEALVKHFIQVISNQLHKDHPKLKRVDSNLFHFIIYDIAEKFKLPIC